MPTYDLTIDSTSRAFRFQTLSIAQVQNGQDRLLVDLYSSDASYRPSIGDEIVLTEDASPIFGGFIDRATEMGAGQQPITPIVTRVSATDYKQLALRRYVSETIASGTLKAALTTLVTNYLSAYGVTLDAGQVNGPTLEALSYDYRRLSEVLDELSDMTGFVWDIDASKVLSMYVPGTTACSFNATTSTVIGDVEVEPNRQDYANRIILKCGPNAVVEVTDTFTGDGIEDTFDLNYDCVGGQQSIDGTRGYVTTNGIFETLRHPTDPDAATWTIDKAAKTITRTSAPTSGHAISITYDAQFPFTIVVEDAGEIASEGIVERVESTDLIGRDACEDLAAGLLSHALSTQKTVRYNTYQTGAAPGLSQTITIAARNVNTSFTITEVVTRDAGRGDGTLLRSVTAVEGASFFGSWRDVIRAWLGGGGSSSGGSVVVESVPGDTGSLQDVFTTRVDGGGAVVATGVFAYTRIPYDCEITAAYLVADQSGSIVLDLWVDSDANFPPTVADTITASAKPTLSSAQKSADTTLTGWTKTLTAGEWLGLTVDSASTVTWAELQLTLVRT